jgi:hypothetical protein
MKGLLTIFLLTFFTLVNAQEIRVDKAEPNISDWFNDYVVLNNEPIGMFSGVQTSNGTIYVAVNDTLATSNLGLIIVTSANNGESWSLFPQGITARTHYNKIKMLRGNSDSVYVAFQLGENIYFWNIISGNFNQFPYTGYRDFDVVISSSNSLYIFLDSLASNHLPRYASLTGGTTWPIRALVSSSAAHPKTYMSGTGDTLVLNYYGPVLADTATSIIRSALYRESVPGTLLSSNFQDVTVAGVRKEEFSSAANNGEVWFVYTEGEPGSRNISARKSINNGVSYEPAITVAGNPNRDEFLFDIVHYNETSGPGGFNLIFYSDSVVAGPGTNETDILYHSKASYGSSGFGSPEQISENPPEYSPDNYVPRLVSLPFSGNDLGALWVGDDGSSKKLFWDLESAEIPVELVSFNASVTGNNVHLLWITASEINNMGFRVERFSDNKWNELGFVNGSGTTTETMSYSYIDYNVTAGKYLYRLKQIDFDGSYEYSNIIEIDITVPDYFELSQNYPNPFNPATIIGYRLAEGSEVTLKIFNALGEEIETLVNEFQEVGTYSIHYNASSKNPSGVYIYRIEAGNFKDTKKMILLR